MSNLELIDRVTFQLLSELNNSEGMRYVALRNKLGVGDSTLANRLAALQKEGYIGVKAVLRESGRNYIVYELTKAGRDYVRRHQITQLFK
jgi:predicted ArsR family transcriptional regulator